jgi:hypothetical protein
MFHTNYSVFLVGVSFTYACNIAFLGVQNAAFVSYILYSKSVGTVYVCVMVRVSIIVVSITFWKFKFFLLMCLM